VFFLFLVLPSPFQNDPAAIARPFCARRVRLPIFFLSTFFSMVPVAALTIFIFFFFPPGVEDRPHAYRDFPAFLGVRIEVFGFF